MRSAMRIDPRRPRWFVLLAGVLAAWAIVAALLILQIAPDTPRSVRGWALLLVAGPPVYVAIEWASGRLLSAEMGVRISSARFSFARIAVAVLVMSIVLAPFAWWFLRHASLVEGARH
jgi:hypothetical protein